MKLAIALIALAAITACTPRQNNAPTPQEVVDRDGRAPIVAKDRNSNPVYRVCIDGNAWLLYRQTIVREIGANGVPVQCTVFISSGN